MRRQINTAPNKDPGMPGWPSDAGWIAGAKHQFTASPADVQQGVHELPSFLTF